ncbi:MAG: hypothetical protein NT053_05105 [Cyanobacteria bacterium]|nr:hypothetical protein [Cyanobacteriota bacterium]
MELPMAGWEYQVIHINVEPPKPQGPPPPADGAATTQPVAGESSGAKPMFSDTFLKKEFPQFYQKPPTEGSASQAQHPAHQLQTFLNGHGAQGWELIGVFPVGNLTMMFFRRSKLSEPKPTRPAQEPAAMKPAMASELAMATAPAVAPASAVGSDSASGPAAEAADNAAAREGTLHEVLRRLEQIEERLRVREVAGEGPTPTGPTPTRRPDRPPRDAGSAQTSAGRAGGSLPGGRQLKAGRSEARSAVSGERVTPAQLANLADATPLTSSRAAQAIGLRSAASLANHGARYGYAPGLSKRGPNGLVAIYTGSGTAEKGGNERRLWIVVPAQRLEG